MTPSNFIPLNQDIAVSPRMRKAMLHACRILDMCLDAYLQCQFKSEIRALRDEIQINNRAARRDAYFEKHLSDPIPDESECEIVEIELDAVQVKKLEIAADKYGITPERYVQLITEAHFYA